MLKSLLTAFAAASIAVAGTASAADKPVTLRYTSNGPAKSPWADQIRQFVADADAESKGSIKVEPFFGGQLGNEQDTVQQVARGRIDIGAFSTGAVSLLLPELQVAIIPFLFDSPAQSDCVMDNHLRKVFAELLEKKGVKLLSIGEVGQIDLIGKRAFVTPKDVAGIKAVSYTKNQKIMWATLGANSSFVGVPDWSSALQTGLVDTTGSPMALYVPSGLNKVAPVLSVVNMWNTQALVIINKRTFERLSKTQQDAILSAYAKQPSSMQRAKIRGLEEFLRQAHKKGGGQIVVPTAEQRAEWAAAVSKSWPEMVKAMGGEAQRLFDIAIAGKKECPVK
ncbi:MAG: TRAP transporter substrate-binding protein [Burkholderiaceae bacterium]|nr:TRAP transporter substrate-binding protein [Burkholderiaceae bacterium]